MTRTAGGKRPVPRDLVCHVGAVRQQKKLTVSRLAELVGCTRFQIMRIEQAAAAPQLPLALRLSRVLEKPVEDLWQVPSQDAAFAADKALWGDPLEE